MELLSSRTTFLKKILLPTLLLCGFGYTLPYFLYDITLPKWIFVPLMLGVVFFACWSFKTFKTVKFDGKNIYISNYLTKEVVPLSCVVEIEEEWSNTHMVTIHFNVVTKFGKKIMFIPKFRILNFASSHPVVTKLKNIISKQSSGGLI